MGFLDKLSKSYFCSGCGGLNTRRPQVYCLKCHSEAMKKWRKNNKLQGEALEKANARSYANTYYNRGKIKKQICRHCGSKKTEMHHEDYLKPLDVVWLCRRCHLELHAG